MKDLLDAPRVGQDLGSVPVGEFLNQTGFDGRGGTFFVEEGVTAFVPGELAVTDRNRVATVLAVGGEEIEERDGAYYVNDVVREVTPINEARLPELRGPIEIPVGSILLLEPRPRPRTMVEIRGRIWYRWAPAADRGPVVWPPGD